MKPIILFSGLLMLLLQACSSLAVAPRTPASDAGYPLDTKTGIHEVDTVLAAVASRDPEKLHKMIKLTTAPCTTVDGLGGPPKCRSGEAAGTLLEVFPVLGNEGSYLRKNEINSLDVLNVNAIYAVYRVSQGALNEPFYPPGNYIVYFVPRENEPVVALHVAEGGIVRIDNLSGDFPANLDMVIKRDTSEVILAPRNR